MGDEAVTVQVVEEVIHLEVVETGPPGAIFGNIDGGSATSFYGGLDAVDGGGS